jgi:flagellar basal-body rod protein FlgC
MNSALNILLSGLNAASLRTSVSASNIANANSTSTRNLGESVDTNNGPYIPQDVVQINQAGGGTLATVIDSDKPPIQLYAPGHPDGDANSIVDFPNIDLAEELVKVQQSSADYKAALKAITYYQNTQEIMLDIFV